MANLRAYAANYLGGGESVTEYESTRVRDTLKLTLDGFVILIIQNKDIITKSISRNQNKFTKSTEILVSDVKEQDVNKVLKIIERICWLNNFLI